MKSIILNHEEISFKIKRIAYQIFETFVDEEELIIAGIAGNGYLFAEKLYDELQSITPLKIHLCQLQINKKNPFESQAAFSNFSFSLEGKCIVVVDDVLHSGTTLIHGVKYFLNYPVKKIKTAVLIDRNHKKFPIKADFKGISLSTSLEEHVQVSFSNDEYEVTLC